VKLVDAVCDEDKYGHFDQANEVLPKMGSCMMNVWDEVVHDNGDGLETTEWMFGVCGS
jgi:hypothetical protein